MTPAAFGYSQFLSPSCNFPKLYLGCDLSETKIGSFIPRQANKTKLFQNSPKLKTALGLMLFNFFLKNQRVLIILKVLFLLLNSNEGI